MTWANRITIGRVLLTVPFVALMLNANEPQHGDQMRYAAMLIFFLMAISDGVDGWLARRKMQATRLGAFLDPMADKLLITATVVVLASEAGAVRGFALPTTLAVVIIGKDVVVALGFAVMHLILGKVPIVPVLAGKAATFLQLAMVLATMIGPEASQLLPHWYWLVWTLWWCSGAAAVVAMLVYIYRGMRYIEQQEGEAGKGNVQ